MNSCDDLEIHILNLFLYYNDTTEFNMRQNKEVLKIQPNRTMKELSGWIEYTPARMSQIMNLLFLSPFIQKEILLSSKSFLHQLTINFAHKISQELLWDKQKELWLQYRDKER